MEEIVKKELDNESYLKPGTYLGNGGGSALNGNVTPLYTRHGYNHYDRWDLRNNRVCNVALTMPMPGTGWKAGSEAE